MSSTLERPALQDASVALWLATLSLMTAYMQNPAPAHRLMAARRIARNLDTLSRQETVFTAECRATFARLAGHWSVIASKSDTGFGNFTGNGPAWHTRVLA